MHFNHARLPTIAGKNLARRSVPTWYTRLISIYEVIPSTDDHMGNAD